MSYGTEAKPRVGFFTDTTLCIGCKACEVACKQWNDVPEDGIEWLGNSYDHTGGLGADTWRHVAFVEQRLPLGVQHGIPKSLAQQAALDSVASSDGVDAELMRSYFAAWGDREDLTISPLVLANNFRHALCYCLS